jgi:hypothetical protein
LLLNHLEGTSEADLPEKVRLKALSDMGFSDAAAALPNRHSHLLR